MEIKVYHDEHMHSKYSEDSHEEITAYLEEAKKAGVSYLMTCEHVDFEPVSYNYDWIADFAALRKECESIKTDILFLYGIELGCRLDHLDRMKEMLASFKFDLVQLSIHDSGKVDYYERKYFKSSDDVRAYLNNVLEGITKFDDFDVLSHFDYGIRSAYDVLPDLEISEFEEELSAIFKVLIEKNKALEVNTKSEERINRPNHTTYFLKLYKKLGGKLITISSDAHQKSDYRRAFDKYLALVKECGFDCVYYYIDRVPHPFYL